MCKPKCSVMYNYGNYRLQFANTHMHTLGECTHTCCLSSSRAMHAIDTLYNNIIIMASIIIMGGPICSSNNSAHTASKATVRSMQDLCIGVNILLLKFKIILHTQQT